MPNDEYVKLIIDLLYRIIHIIDDNREIRIQAIQGYISTLMDISIISGDENDNTDEDSDY